MSRHSSPVRLVRRACRRCRNYTNNIVAPCPCCGTALPRVRFKAIPLWAGAILLAAAAIGFAGHGPLARLAAAASARSAPEPQAMQAGTPRQ